MRLNQAFKSPTKFKEQKTEDPSERKLRDAQEKGNVVKSFGAGMFIWPHGLHVDREGNVWGTDAAGQSFKPKRGEQYEAGVKWEPVGLPVQAAETVATQTRAIPHCAAVNNQQGRP